MNQTNINFINTLYTELRKHRGSMLQVCKHSGRTREWVRWVLQGKYNDDDVILSATEVLKSINKQKKTKEAIARKNLESVLS